VKHLSPGEKAQGAVDLEDRDPGKGKRESPIVSIQRLVGQEYRDTGLAGPSPFAATA
jgi:hypothetical protein